MTGCAKGFEFLSCILKELILSTFVSTDKIFSRLSKTAETSSKSAQGQVSSNLANHKSSKKMMCKKM